MSHEGNTIFLEHVRDSFNSSEDPKMRLAYLSMLRSRRFGDEADVLEEDWYAERAQFLAVHGAQEKDVMHDEDEEFIIQVEEVGNPTEEGYAFQRKRVVIPDYLDVEKHLIRNKHGKDSR